VLNFSDPTFAEWFEDGCRIEIYDAKYSWTALRKQSVYVVFIEVEDAYTVSQVLQRLWAYRNTVRPYVAMAATDDHRDNLLFSNIMTEIESGGLIPRTDAIERFADNHALEELVTAIGCDIQASKPAAALDRLHTYCMKKFGHLLNERGISFSKDERL
jgi:hypothetical protein